LSKFFKGDIVTMWGNRTGSWAAAAGTAAVLLLAGCGSGSATAVKSNAAGNAATAGLFEPGNGNITSLNLRGHAVSSLQGKTLAWVPVGLGVPLTDEWTYVMKTRAEALGMKFITRDPNWDTNSESQAVAGLVAQHPDVLVLHNPDVQLLANQIKQAQDAGIYVIQVNMVSNYKSDAYIGADWQQLGSSIAEHIVSDCGPGTSGQVAIVEGPRTSGASLDQLAGAMSVFKQHPEIHIVSDQSGGNWDASVAKNVTDTVVKQYPNLCADYGFWGVMENGAAQSIKNAGMVGKTKVYASGGGAPVNCSNLRQGLFTGFVHYDAPLQAQQIVDTASFLLQSGLKAGTLHLAAYSPLTYVTAATVTDTTCYTPKVTLP
jgi:ribose transport system substrate-binding protein